VQMNYTYAVRIAKKKLLGLSHDERQVMSNDDGQIHNARLRR